MIGAMPLSESVMTGPKRRSRRRPAASQRPSGEHLRLEQDGGGTAGGEFAEGKRHFGCRAQVLVDAGGRRQRLHGERISEMVGDADGVRRALRLQGLRDRHLEGGEDGLRLGQGQRSAPFFERVFDDAAGGGDVGGYTTSVRRVFPGARPGCGPSSP